MKHFQQIESTHIAAIAYDDASQTLSMHFTNGSVYDYPRVDSALYGRLMGAESRGSFFAEHIKTKFRAKRVR